MAGRKWRELLNGGVLNHRNHYSKGLLAMFYGRRLQPSVNPWQPILYLDLLRSVGIVESDMLSVIIQC